MGYYGGRPFLDKYGKYLLIKKKHLDLSEQWFEKYGSGVIFTARFIPVVRHAISIPAGIAKMSWKKFTLYTTCAIIPWSIFFIFLGERLGSHWKEIDEIAQPYLRPVIIVAIVVTVIYIALQVYRRKRT
jgi:membrane protein DedA with SNARE-associated domain